MIFKQFQQKQIYAAHMKNYDQIINKKVSSPNQPIKHKISNLPSFSFNKPYNCSTNIVDLSHFYSPIKPQCEKRIKNQNLEISNRLEKIHLRNNITNFQNNYVPIRNRNQGHLLLAVRKFHQKKELLQNNMKIAKRIVQTNPCINSLSFQQSYKQHQIFGKRIRKIKKTEQNKVIKIGNSLNNINIGSGSIKIQIKICKLNLRTIFPSTNDQFKFIFKIPKQQIQESNNYYLNDLNKLTINIAVKNSIMKNLKKKKIKIKIRQIKQTQEIDQGVCYIQLNDFYNDSMNFIQGYRQMEIIRFKKIKNGVLQASVKVWKQVHQGLKQKTKKENQNQKNLTKQKQKQEIYDLKKQVQKQQQIKNDKNNLNQKQNKNDQINLKKKKQNNQLNKQNQKQIINDQNMQNFKQNQKNEKIKY